MVDTVARHSLKTCDWLIKNKIKCTLSDNSMDSEINIIESVLGHYEYYLFFIMNTILNVNIILCNEYTFL